MAVAAGGGQIQAAAGGDGGQNQVGANDLGSWSFNGSTIKILKAKADAYVDQSLPTINFGRANDLNVRGRPEQRSYVRFDLSSISGTVQKAVLVLGPEKSSPDGFDVKGSASNWSETTITYVNAPPPGALLGRSGSVQNDRPEFFDVTAYVASAGSAASFALTASVAGMTKDIELDSREQDTVQQPFLVIATTPGPPTPTPPPPPVITSSPPANSTSSSATFTFTDSRSGVTFLCKLDTAPYTPCTSPTTYTGLMNGQHTFSVEATDAGGTSSPTSYTWRVTLPDNTPPPAPILDTTPTNPSTSTTATFTFHDTEAGVTFLCSIDGGAAALCTSPKTYTVAVGPHTFTVSARDAAGNTSGPTSYTWTVAPLPDTTPPPAPTITGKPDNPTASTSATFTFTDSESGVTYQCSLDSAAPAPCSSGVTYNGLAIGNHTFSVTAQDAAGNTSTAATYQWGVQQEFVVNGSFEADVSGWSSFQGVITHGTNGTVGTGDAHVALQAGNTGQFTIFPSTATNSGVGKPPVSSTTAGWVYTASAWVRSDSIGRNICIHVRERNTTTNAIVNEVTRCVSSTNAWQQIGPLQYTPVAAGDSLTVFVALENGVAGDSFDVDGISLLGGTPPPGPPPSPTPDPVIVAGGDIACSLTDTRPQPSFCMQQATADVIASINPVAVLALGDIQYECGQLADYPKYTSSWGPFKATTHPVPGNHDYGDTSTGTTCTPSDAADYYAYWGLQAGPPAQGYYSYDIGTWHIIALNSECTHIGGCGVGSPEEVWLRNDLATHPALCTIAYWHEPRFSAGQTGMDTRSSAFWTDLYNAHAEIVLNGHDHTYQRWGRMNASGALDTSGPREVVVGTGGEELFRGSLPPLGTFPSLTQQNDQTFGVLKLTLHATGYEGDFVPAAGSGGFSDHFGPTPCTP